MHYQQLMSGSLMVAVLTRHLYKNTIAFYFPTHSCKERYNIGKKLIKSDKPDKDFDICMKLIADATNTTTTSVA